MNIQINTNILNDNDFNFRIFILLSYFLYFYIINLYKTKILKNKNELYHLYVQW